MNISQRTCRSSLGVFNFELAISSADSEINGSNINILVEELFFLNNDSLLTVYTHNKHLKFAFMTEYWYIINTKNPFLTINQ